MREDAPSPRAYRDNRGGGVVRNGDFSERFELERFSMELLSQGSEGGAR
jgi:hypothetical protein